LGEGGFGLKESDVSGLQPSNKWSAANLGLRPRLYVSRRWRSSPCRDSGLGGGGKTTSQKRDVGELASLRMARNNWGILPLTTQPANWPGTPIGSEWQTTTEILACGQNDDEKQIQGSFAFGSGWRRKTSNRPEGSCSLRSCAVVRDSSLRWLLEAIASGR